MSFDKERLAILHDLSDTLNAEIAATVKRRMNLLDSTEEQYFLGMGAASAMLGLLAGIVSVLDNIGLTEAARKTLDDIRELVLPGGEPPEEYKALVKENDRARGVSS